MSQLFQPFQMGDLRLANRIVMAPMTRSRADAQGVQGGIAATYYSQRSSAGLIITEATAVSRQGSGYPNIPGIWNKEQTESWKNVTRAVHEKNGKIFLQIFHAGRIGHTSLMDEQPVSSAARLPQGQVMAADFTMQDYEKPRALKIEEIPAIVAQFKTGAENAQRAGFDGLEIHAANGYLLDQFLRDGVNDRMDEYGGSLENRTRLLREVVEVAVSVWGPWRVGVRFSPFTAFNSMSDSNPEATFIHAVKSLNDFSLAYIHITDMASPGAAKLIQKIRAAYKGVVIASGGLTHESGEKLIEENTADLAAYGTLYISNPDLVERFDQDLPLAQADKATFYTPGEKGYTDYPPARKNAA